MQNTRGKKTEVTSLGVVHGFWYRNWRFPFFHYQEPILIIIKGKGVYSWNGKIWIKKKKV